MDRPHTADPFADPTNQRLLERFFAELEQRDFPACSRLLDEEQQRRTGTASQPIVAYCRAILYAEQNRWDRSERVLTPLLRANPHPGLRMRALNVLAIAHEHLGRLAEAIDLYNRALALVRTQGDLTYWAKVAKNRAICTIRAYEAGQIGEDELHAARRDLEKSIDIFRAQGERLLEGRGWNELGATYKAVGRWDEAIACYRRDLAICEEVGDRHCTAASLNNIGEALAAQGQYAEAESLLTRAADLFAATGDAFEEADALTNLGRALAGQGKMQAATGAFERAVRCVESVRSGIGTEVARMDFFATQTHVYGAPIGHCLRQGDAETAFDFSERARARGMLDLLAGADVHTPPELPAPLRAQEQRLRARLAEAASLDGAVQRALERELAALHRRMQVHAPEYVSLREPLPPAVAEIRSRLPADTVLLAYFALPNRLVGFVVPHAEELVAVNLKVTAEELVHASFDADGRPRGLVPGPSKRLSRPWLLERLHTALVEPLLRHCPDTCRRLVIVPHGPLHWLPLHAAYDRSRGAHLCEVYDVIYAPSATLQVVHIQAKRRPAERRGVLAVAPTDEALHHAVAEARAVTAAVGGMALTGPAATAEQLRRQANRFRYLHLASHVHFRADAPLLSGVDLADGRLTAWDLLRTPDLGFALAWINGCESGVSQVRPGDELLGLARALLYSVAPSVLLTLWPVADLPARIFAHVFYRELAGPTVTAGERFSRVLREAVRAFRRVTTAETAQILGEDGLSTAEIEAALARLPRATFRPWSSLSPSDHCPFDHPYFWAAYALIGEVWPTI